MYCSGTFRCDAHGLAVVCEPVSGSAVQVFPTGVGFRQQEQPSEASGLDNDFTAGSTNRRARHRKLREPRLGSGHLLPTAICECNSRLKAGGERPGVPPKASMHTRLAMATSATQAALAAASATSMAEHATSAAAAAVAAAAVAQVFASPAIATHYRRGEATPGDAAWSIVQNASCGGKRLRVWVEADGAAADANYGSPYLHTVSECRMTCAMHIECKGFSERLRDGLCAFWRGERIKPLIKPGARCHRKVIGETVDLCSVQGRLHLSTHPGAQVDEVHSTVKDKVVALRDSLLGTYSQQLYRGLSRVPAAHSLKVVYLRLLDNATLLSKVQRVCQCDSVNLHPFYKTHSRSHNIADTIWIHGNDTVIGANEWAEVTHCPDAEEHGAWFYVAPGSGISINVGRTLVMDYRTDRSAQRLHTHTDRIRLRDQFDPIYDSVQFLHRKHSFSRELKHELVMLRWTQDADFVRHRFTLPRRLIV